jgi:hypothetical protein
MSRRPAAGFGRLNCIIGHTDAVLIGCAGALCSEISPRYSHSKSSGRQLPTRVGAPGAELDSVNPFSSVISQANSYSAAIVIGVGWPGHLSRPDSRRQKLKGAGANNGIGLAF